MTTERISSGSGRARETDRQTERERLPLPAEGRRHGDTAERARDEDDEKRERSGREEDADRSVESGPREWVTCERTRGGEGKGGEKKRIKKKAMLAGGTVAHRHAIMWRLGLIYTRERRGCRGK